MNIYLIIAGCLSAIAALLHVLIIFNGAAWYKFFGAGDRFVQLSLQGSIYPNLVTLGIVVVLSIWSAYAFSGAGVIRELPLLKVALLIITTIYLLRGLVIIPIYFYDKSLLSWFVLWSSAISFIFGMFYLLGMIKKY